MFLVPTIGLDPVLEDQESLFQAKDLRKDSLISMD